MICPPSGNGYEEFCYRLFDAPEQIDEQARKMLQRAWSSPRQARDCGADAVFNACDIADNHGVFFSPAQLERFWTPYLHKWATAVTEMGLYTILHSDGNLTSILDVAGGIAAARPPGDRPNRRHGYRVRQEARGAKDYASAATSIAACCTLGRPRRSSSLRPAYAGSPNQADGSCWVLPTRYSGRCPRSTTTRWWQRGASAVPTEAVTQAKR